MKHLKILALLTIGTAVLAFPGSAWATTATAPAGTAYTGSVSGGNNGNVTLEGKGFSNVTCSKSSVAGKNESHGSSVTAKGAVSTLTFTECNQHVKVVKNGTLEYHAIGSGNATVTSSGGEITVEWTTIFGNVHCIYTTNNTDFGTATGAPSNTGHATIHTDSGWLIPHGSGLCPEARWIGTYDIFTPTGTRWD